MSTIDDVLHKLIDVSTGRSNLPPHEADELHEAITPGYTAAPPSDEEIAAAEKVLARKAQFEQPAEPVAPSDDEVAKAKAVLAATGG